jgi:hypothetical protein
LWTFHAVHACPIVLVSKYAEIILLVVTSANYLFFQGASTSVGEIYLPHQEVTGP